MTSPAMPARRAPHRARVFAGWSCGLGMALALAVLALPARAADGPPLERHEYRRIVMGVEARLVLYAESAYAARAAAEAAFARLDELDAILSDWREDSELSRLVAAAGGESVEISEDLYQVLSGANFMTAVSSGAFDVTVKPLVDLWRDARRAGEPPTREAIEAALELVGPDVLQVDSWLRPRGSPPARARLARPGMGLDLGGIAKGYAVDAARDVLASYGVSSALVQLGGDLALGDPPPGQGAWYVDVGCGEGELPPLRLALTNVSVSTSGDSEQHFVHEGVRYSHAIDPRTGLAKTDDLCVTVVATFGVLSDPLASATRVLGAQGGRRIVDSFEVVPNVGARLIVDGEPLLAPPAERTPGPWRDLLADASAWEFVGGGEVVPLPESMIADGVLAIPSSPPSGWLRTVDDFRDFQLRLDFRLARMANGGLFLRATRDDSNPAYSGCEVQLLDDFHWEAETNSTLQPWQFTGSLYAAVPPGDRDALAPIGVWNSLEVLCLGSRMAAMLNGRLLWDVDTAELEVEPPFAARAALGALGLQRYAAPSVEGDVAVWVRNFFVRDL